jgi:hypothetical protein
MKSSTSKPNVNSGKLDQAAKAAAPRNAQDKEAMRQAEDEGSPDRPPPDKQAPGKHPRGRDPIPEKLSGR